MDAPQFSPPECRRLASWLAAWRIVAILAVAVSLADAAEEPAPASGGAVPAFQPGELSIGEPVPLPFGSGTAPGTTATAPADDPRATRAPASVGDAPVPGSGWLGLAVAESTVPGRWRVEEVTAGGPAARAGIVAGDELRAVNGTTLASAEQVSQALTAITAGQDVRVAVARADRVSEVVLRAEPRPAPRAADPTSVARQGGPLGGDRASPAAAATAPAAATSAAASPDPTGTAAAPGWQASSRPDEPGTASRFGRTATNSAAVPPGRMALDPGPAAMPAPFVPPATTAPTLGTTPATGRTALGVRTVPIDEATQARFRLPEPTGAYVIGVVQELPAARAGVPPGSVIVAVGDRPVRSPVELTRLVENGPLDRPVQVQFVLPGGESKRADVVLQPLDAAIERAFVGDPAPVTTVPPLRSAPEPRRAERPADDEAVIRAEIRAIRSRLEILERLLDPLARRPR